MSIELEVMLIPPVQWDEFVEKYPPFSIALDGFVEGPPRFDAGPHDPNATGGKRHEPRANFNHHERVDRLATRATCGQVLMALRQGLFRCFRDEYGHRATVYVNDCDEDVCTAWFLLKNHHLCEQTINPLLNRLVAMEDALDATAGAYPFTADLPVLRELAWVFEPYRKFRLNGGLDQRDPASYRSIIEDVSGRISKHIVGAGDEIALDTRYEKIGGGPGWVMVKEIGAQARTGMFSDSISAYVSVREKAGGVWTYTIGRLSPFISMDLEGLTAKLNEVEGATDDRWGGGNTIIGSPRKAGSRIPPDELAHIIANGKYVLY